MITESTEYLYVCFETYLLKYLCQLFPLSVIAFWIARFILLLFNEITCARFEKNSYSYQRSFEQTFISTNLKFIHMANN